MLAEFAGHIIEIAGEHGDLVVCLDSDSVGEIPMRHRYCSRGEYLERCHDTPCQEERHSTTQRNAQQAPQEHPPTCPGDLQMHLMQGQSHPHCAPFLCAAWDKHWHSNIIILPCSPRTRHTLDESRPGLYGLLAHRI